MTISQKDYNRQYYLMHRDDIKSRQKQLYYQRRGTFPKKPKTEEERLSEKTVVCPLCKRSRIYSLRCNARRAQRLKTVCNDCAAPTRMNGRKGIPLRPETKLKISIGNTGKIITADTKRKLREARVRELRQKYQTTPNYNSEACRYFNWLSQQNNWHLQHAENGGEITKCGYFLDAYDEINNIVVEYDEKKHRGKRQHLRDEQKQKELIEELGCRFYRYDEVSQNLRQVA